jgi:hypothetical protein
VWEALGVLEPSLEASKKAFAVLSQLTEKGAARRKLLQDGVQSTAHEFQAVGVEMNHHYKSTVVYLSDEGPRPSLPEDPVLEYQITTYPGGRPPHAWINTRRPGKKFSTIDLAGHSAFCLLTGIGGGQCKVAAGEVGKQLGLEIRSYSIGWLQDYEDFYFEWAKRREIQEDGCILVRPDRFVAWRSHKMVPGCEKKLNDLHEEYSFSSIDPFEAFYVFIFNVHRQLLVTTPPRLSPSLLPHTPPHHCGASSQPPLSSQPEFDRCRELPVSS